MERVRVETSTTSASTVERRERGIIAGVLAGDRAVSLLSVVVGLTLWQVAAGQVSELILPAPSAVLARFADPAWVAHLRAALAGSLTQLAIGFALSLAVAVPLGIVIGRSSLLSRMFEPLISALYAIPPVAFIPFLIIWFGLFLEARIALVFLMSVFDILVVIIAGARDVRPALMDVGRSFGASYGQRFRLVVLPALTPWWRRWRGGRVAHPSPGDP